MLVTFEVSSFEISQLFIWVKSLNQPAVDVGAIASTVVTFLIFEATPAQGMFVPSVDVLSMLAYTAVIFLSLMYQSGSGSVVRW